MQTTTHPPIVARRLPTLTLYTLSRRIQSEYDEMPGLCLTLTQAERFWNLDRSTCTHVLDELVKQGYLRRSGFRYLRAS